ncbi:Membrane protein DedA, SNARE-associated domain [Burkholderiales bacterium 8X]|nr:Membrane protein DedA, SNARE-associated domain [Burkholderiales bacterium 8X]
MEQLVSLLAAHGPLVVFVATLLARIGAPVPATPFLIVAGALSVGGTVSLPAIVAAALIGNLVGDGAWFLAGRRWGLRVLRLLCRISLSADACVARSESILGRWGGLSLLAAKFVPGVSVVAPPMAGAMGMTNARFLAYETGAALAWTLALVMLGRAFHGAIEDVLALLSSVGLAAFGLMVVMLAIYGGWRLHQRGQAARVEDVAFIEVEALRAAMAQGQPPVLVDLRSEDTRSLDSRAVSGAIGMPATHLVARLPADFRGRDLVLFCDCPDDVGAVSAARLLQKAGFTNVRVLAGGLDGWMAAAARVASTERPEAGHRKLAVGLS